METRNENTAGTSTVERLEKFDAISHIIEECFGVRNNAINYFSFFRQSLIEHGFFNAPASLKYHGAYDGGLFDHSFAVMINLLEMTNKLGLKWERMQSPYIVGLFHDLCKVDDYRYNSISDSWEWNKFQIICDHGEKSLVMLQKFMTLTDEETACIRWHMGAFCDKEEWNFYGKAVERYPNVLYTHTADMYASRVLGV